MTFESEIATIMRDLSSKDWNIRFRSLQKLQVIVAEHGDDNSAWTRDILVALHKPLMAQLKDLRSSIVREASKVLSIMSKTFGNSYSVIGRYLVETQLNMIGGGNKVIADYIDESMQTIFQSSHIKGAIQVIEKIAADSKSALVREKSFLYLAIILENWDITSLRKYESAIKDSIKHGISDAAVNARSQARRCFAAFAPIFPEQASHMLKHFDHRTQKTLRALLKPGDLLLLSSKGKSTKHSKIRRPQRTIQTSNNSSNASSANASPKTSPTAEGQYESTDAHQNSTQRPRSATLYEHISPKFHGIEMGQDDLARRGTASVTTNAKSEVIEALAIGDRVWVEGSEEQMPATIRFVGQTEFARGMWVGLELDAYEGRNDGSVKGIRYFSCPKGKGLFRRFETIIAMTPQEIIDTSQNTHLADDELREQSQEPLAAVSMHQDNIPLSKQLGFQILSTHRRHIDQVLAALRVEMQELTAFETNAASFSTNFVLQYIHGVRRRVQHRKSLHNNILQELDSYEMELGQANE